MKLIWCAQGAYLAMLGVSQIPHAIWGPGKCIFQEGRKNRSCFGGLN